MAGEAWEQEQDPAIRKLGKRKRSRNGGWTKTNKQTLKRIAFLSPRHIVPPATLLSAKDSITIPNSVLGSGSQVQV